jgi:hypothetical protein
LTAIDFDGFTYGFPTSWLASRDDEWSFYRRQFSKQFDGIKAVDLLAFDTDSKTLWLIEAKDYAKNDHTKPSELSDEIAEKVIFTLAALLPASLNANDAQEKELAKACLSARQIRVALHLEQPHFLAPFPKGTVNLSNISDKLKRTVRAVDPHPQVVSIDTSRNLAWSVQRTTKI